MNPYLPQQNFYSQQLRALALVEEIDSLHLKAGRRSVGVIGAGVAGRTLAAAFYAQGANVFIIDKSEIEFGMYRNATHRELHPNIIFWPFEKPSPVTSLPFLNWAQSPAAEVVKDLIREWNSGFGKVIKIFHEEVKSVSEKDDEVCIELKNGLIRRTDICVLATGFAYELGVGNLETTSYWSPSAVVEDSSNSILVSGAGDGGLIDALSPILGTDVTTAAHILASRLYGKASQSDICEIERERYENIKPGTKDSTSDCSFYDKFILEPEIEADIESFMRVKTAKVVLLYSGTSAYSYTAAPINKLLLSHFSKSEKSMLVHEKGRLELDQSSGNAVINYANKSAKTPEAVKDFKKIVVRHGAQPGLVSILNNESIDKLRSAATKYPEAARISDYNRKYYSYSKNGIGQAAIGHECIVETIENIITKLRLKYDLKFKDIKFKNDCFLTGNPIKVALTVEDTKKAERIGLFPIKVGATSIILAPKGAAIRGTK